MYTGDRGTILGQFLISTAVLLVLAPCITLILLIQLNALSFDESVQDEIALAQLRRILAVSEDADVSGHTMSFTYHCERNMLYETNGHLILTPGTQIFLSDIDSASFRRDGHEIRIVYSRSGKEYVRVLTHD